MAVRYVHTIFVTCFMICCHGRFFVQFEGDRDELVVREGTNIILKCNVIDENPRVRFEWYRYGADDAHEVIGVQMAMTNDYLERRPNSTFTISNNYESLNNDKDAIYTMNITAARVEDNARYGCGTSEQISTGLATLHVQQTPSVIHLYGSKQPLTGNDADRLDPYHHNQMVTVNEHERGYFMCVADGFIPEPTLVMTFDERPLDIRQEVVDHLETSPNHPSYKYNIFGAVAVSEGPLEMQVEANRMPLKCRAIVRETGAVVETIIRPVLKTSPKIVCSNITVPYGSRNETITCIIDADPEVDHAVWIWNATGGRKTLGLGQTHEMMYTSRRHVLEDGRWQVSLAISQIDPSMFHRYRLFANNTVGNSSDDAWINREYKTDQGHSGSSTVCTTTSSLIVVAVICQIIV